jgi:subfamily B ATP-binding cassette protein MsbA
VVDDLVDNTGERQELTEEAYQSAMRLLKNLEVLEENSKLASAQK